MKQTTITVEENTLERFKAMKRDLDMSQAGPDHTADTFLNALMDTWEAADEGMYDEETLSPGEFESKMHKHNQKVLNRVDDLETELKTTLEGLR